MRLGIAIQTSVQQNEKISSRIGAMDRLKNLASFPQQGSSQYAVISNSGSNDHNFCLLKFRLS
jgi:hypothetical protein